MEERLRSAAQLPPAAALELCAGVGPDLGPPSSSTAVVVDPADEQESGAEALGLADGAVGASVLLLKAHVLEAPLVAGAGTPAACILRAIADEGLEVCGVRSVWLDQPAAAACPMGWCARLLDPLVCPSLDPRSSLTPCRAARRRLCGRGSRGAGARDRERAEWRNGAP